MMVYKHIYFRGLLEYTNPVSYYWPEFAQNGKEDMTVETVVSHMVRQYLCIKYSILPASNFEQIHVIFICNIYNNLSFAYLYNVISILFSVTEFLTF